MSYLSLYSDFCLSRWYIFNIIDQFLHESQIKAAYGYILLYFPIAVSRFTADIFLLVGTQILISYQLAFQLRTQIRVWRLAGIFVLLVLWTIALYYLFSLLAVEVLWLQMADPDIIRAVATRQNQFEASFFIIQFLVTLTMVTLTAVVVWIWHKGGSIPRVRRTRLFCLKEEEIFLTVNIACLSVRRYHVDALDSFFCRANLRYSLPLP